MISWEGKEWTGKKYTKLAFFLAISRNSGAQKGRALPGDLWQLNLILRANGVEGFVSNFINYLSKIKSIEDYLESPEDSQSFMIL
jgi:hypothetical protein